jgi:hypothetical protein
MLAFQKTVAELRSVVPYVHCFLNPYPVRSDQRPGSFFLHRQGIRADGFDYAAT